MYLLFKMSSCLPCLPLQASLEISCATYSDILYLNLTKDCQEFVQIMSWRSVNSSVTVSSSRLWATMLTPGCQPHICFNSTQKKNTNFLPANWPPSSNSSKRFLHPNVKTHDFSSSGAAILRQFHTFKSNGIWLISALEGIVEGKWWTLSRGPSLVPLFVGWICLEYACQLRTRLAKCSQEIGRTIDNF